MVVAAAALLLPGAARSAACSPLDCAPSQFTLDHGRLLAVRSAVDEPLRVVDLRTGATRWRLPSGIVAGDTLISQSDGTLLTWYDLASGDRLGDAELRARGAFQLVGASQNGSRAVLERTQTRATSFAIVSGSRQRTVRLGAGHWSFDALRGSKLFLIETLKVGYQVRLFDLAGNRLAAAPLKDPGESATILGAPFARASSADGRYLFTLYIGGDGGAMIHVLDLVAGTARCVDLPGGGSFDAAMTWALVPDPDGRQVWALSPGYGRVVAVDAAAHRIRRTWRFDARGFAGNAGVAALSPDGAHFALADGEHVWFLALEPKVSVLRRARVSTALGWSPDQRKLWLLGARSRVSSLRPG